jgi:adenylate kinase
MLKASFFLPLVNRNDIIGSLPLQMHSNPLLNFVFINGKNSAGKDTQAAHILENVPNSLGLSTGDIYRGAKSEQGEYTKFHLDVQPYIDLIDNHGGLLPDDVITKIVQEVVEEKAAQGIKTFVFTGFPRTIPQLASTDEMIARLWENHPVNVSYVCLAVLDEHSMQRSQIRKEGDIAAGLEPRPDDEPAIVQKRLATYRRLTEPMLHLLAREGRLMIIKGSGNKEEVSHRTVERLSPRTGGSTERK